MNSIILQEMIYYTNIQKSMIDSGKSEIRDQKPEIEKKKFGDSKR